ncbi:hypothetical protein [Pollutibacter soli]|uniref:hypothetical protein n=1 Tax=Pollutibacter soli TaxID=3034157 RepID=UPI0030135AB0
MFNFQIAEQKLKDEPSLVDNISLLLERIFTNKKFVFELDGVSELLPILLEYGIIEKNGEKYQVAHNNLFYYAVYREYTKTKSFVVNNSVEDLFAFLDLFETEFDGITQKFGITRFLSGVFSIAIYHQHLNFQTDIIEISKKWEGLPNRQLEIFTTALIKFLPFHRYQLDDFLFLLHRVFTLYKYEEKEVFNITLNEIAKSLTAYSILQEGNSLALLEKIKSNHDPIDDIINNSLFIGFINSIDNYLENLVILFSNKYSQPSIINALSAKLTFNEKETATILGLLKTHQPFEQKALVQIPRLINALVNRTSEITEENINTCFDILFDLLNIKEFEVQISVLNSVRHIDNYDSKKVKLLEKVLTLNHSTEKLIPHIAWVLYSFKDSKFYFDFLITYAYTFKFRINEDVFEHNIPWIRNISPEVFDKDLVHLVIHNDGEIRWLGRILVKTVSAHQNGFELSKALLHLPAKEQFKFFVSILSYLHDPEMAIPILLPLLESKDDLVVESLLCKLELLTEDYGSLITDILNHQWPEKTTFQESVISRIHDYLVNHSKIIDEKNSIKEIDPYYTQQRFLNEYLKVYTKNLQQGVSENVDQKSQFLRFAKKVVVAKSGGWKNPGSGEITKLSTFSTKMTLPISYFISPDNYEWEKLIERTENWSNFFPEWNPQT